MSLKIGLTCLMLGSICTSLYPMIKDEVLPPQLKVGDVEEDQMFFCEGSQEYCDSAREEDGIGRYEIIEKYKISELMEDLHIVPPLGKKYVNSNNSFIKQEISCLAKQTYEEATKNHISDMIAAAFATLNRVEDSRFPNTICGVVRQKINGRHQMSWVGNPRKNKDITNFKNKTYLKFSQLILQGKFKRIKKDCRPTNWHNVAKDSKGAWNADQILKGRVKCSFMVEGSPHIYIQIKH